MPNKTLKKSQKPNKNKKLDKNKKEEIELDEPVIEEEDEENIDPKEKDIAELLTKSPKPRKVEKLDIDKWLIDREIENAENGDDWY